MKTMKAILLAAYLTLSVSLGASEPFPLRDLRQSIERLLSSDNPEQSELAYLAARGTNLSLYNEN